MARIGGNRWVLHLPQTAIGYTKSDGYFAKMGNCDLEVLADQAGFGDISYSKKPHLQHKIWGNRINYVGNAVSSLRGMFTIFLTRAANMSPEVDRQRKRKCPTGWGKLMN